MSQEDKKEVLIPDEILPPAQDGDGAGQGKRGMAKRAERAFGPIVAGAIIDAIDFVTWGPAGLIIGGVAAFWICTIYRLPLAQRLLSALAAGIYCAIPFTRFIPLATLIGAYVRFLETRAE